MVGVVVTVVTVGGSFTSVVPAHTYGASHARQVIVGTAGAAATVTVSRPGLPALRREVTGENARVVENFRC